MEQKSGQAGPREGKIIYRENLTDDLLILRIQPADGSEIPDFKPGQFVTLGLKFPGEDNFTYRAYSIASPPEEKRYFELYIKWAAEPVPGKFTSTLMDMREGDSIYWRKPAGAFTMEDKKPDGSPEDRRLVLVASGTGLAPFISYIGHLKKVGSKREIVLLHGAKNAAELGYKSQMEELAKDRENGGRFTYITTVSRPDGILSKGWQGNVGRVETLLASRDGMPSKLEQAIGEKVTPANSFFYVCGYQGTIDSVVSLLAPLGFVTNRSRRKDGSFDVKIETYG